MCMADLSPYPAFNVLDHVPAHVPRAAPPLQDVTDVNVPLTRDVGGGARDQGLAVKGELAGATPPGLARDTCTADIGTLLTWTL